MKENRLTRYWEMEEGETYTHNLGTYKLESGNIFFYRIDRTWGITKKSHLELYKSIFHKIEKETVMTITELEEKYGIKNLRIKGE
jgi:hypothetical protein